MVELLQTAEFKAWINTLKVQTARARINARLLRLVVGNRGDCRGVGDGVSELRFMFGPGYRIYFSHIGETIILLLVGGDKGSQFNDIIKAKKLLRQWKEQQDE